MGAGITRATVGDTTRPWAGPAGSATGSLLSPAAEKIRQTSISVWGRDRRLEIVGRSQGVVDLLEQVEKIAPYDEPVLVMGESGVGKEYIAQAIYLLGDRCRKPWVVVNCPQYQEGNLTVSELFGHQKGSFTGAVADRKGCFETANRGVVFLDEIGDLHMSAQVMLLRSLATGEFQPLGAERTRRVNVRVIAATNRSLNELARDRQFRRELLFRLRYFLLEIPPLRQRGDDWRLLIDYTLRRLHRRHGVEKRFSDDSYRLLADYTWPGNVRELITVVTAGYALADGDVIQPRDFANHLEKDTAANGSQLDRLFTLLCSRPGSFWELVRDPFLERDLNRTQVRRLVALGLRGADGSYRRLVRNWGLGDDEYQRFMDFLRHHRLKPGSFGELFG